MTQEQEQDHYVEKESSLLKIRSRALRWCNLLLSSIDLDGELLELIQTFQREDIIQIGQNIYKYCAMRDAGWEGLPIIKQRDSICSNSHGPKYKMREDSTYYGSIQAFQRDYCSCDGRHGPAGMGARMI